MSQISIESAAVKNTWESIFLVQPKMSSAISSNVLFFPSILFSLKKDIIIFPFHGCINLSITHFIVGKKYFSFFPTHVNKFYYVEKKKGIEKRFIKSKMEHEIKCFFEMETSTSILNFFGFHF